MYSTRSVFLFLLCAACSGTPSGPAIGMNGPTGSLYIGWWLETEARNQVYRVSAADGSWEEVPIPYYTLQEYNAFDVAPDGSGLLFIPPAPTIAWMPDFDSTKLQEVIQDSYRRSPLLSPDRRFVATIVVQQFIPRNVLILDMTTGVEKVVATMPDNGGWRLDHWFAGGD